MTKTRRQTTNHLKKKTSSRHFHRSKGSELRCRSRMDSCEYEQRIKAQRIQKTSQKRRHSRLTVAFFFKSTPLKVNTVQVKMRHRFLPFKSENLFKVFSSALGRVTRKIVEKTKQLYIPRALHTFQPGLLRSANLIPRKKSEKKEIYARRLSSERSRSEMSDPAEPQRRRDRADSRCL